MKYRVIQINKGRVPDTFKSMLKHEGRTGVEQLQPADVEAAHGKLLKFQDGDTARFHPEEIVNV